MPPRALIITLLGSRDEPPLQLAHLRLAGELAHVDGAERARPDRIHPLENRLLAALSEILEGVPGGIDRERGDEPDIEIETQTERLVLRQGWARMGTAVDRHDRCRYARAGCADLFGRLQGIEPDEVDSGLFHIGNRARNRGFEASALGAQNVTACADHEIRIERIARRDRSLELADRLIERDAATARADRRLLRRFLVLDL